MGKPTICTCENKGADQLHSNREADQRLCFRYTDSTIPLLLKYKISSLYPSSVLVQLGLCRTCSETPKTVFLASRLISYIFNNLSILLEKASSQQNLHSIPTENILKEYCCLNKSRLLSACTILLQDQTPA